MYNDKKPGDTLATADFRVHGTGWDDSPVDVTVHAELYVSGAFQYGNQTGMSFEWSNNPMPETFDTRYENVSPENFKEFAKEVLKNRIMKTLTVEEI